MLTNVFDRLFDIFDYYLYFFDLNIDRTLLLAIQTPTKEKGYNYSVRNSLNTVGVKEVFDHLEEKIDYNPMVELIKQNTRRFAKRQMTWFRKDKNIKWMKVEDEKDFTRIATEIFTSFFRNN